MVMDIVARCLDHTHQLLFLLSHILQAAAVTAAVIYLKQSSDKSHRYFFRRQRAIQKKEGRIVTFKNSVTEFNALLLFFFFNPHSSFNHQTCLLEVTEFDIFLEGKWNNECTLTIQTNLKRHALSFKTFFFLNYYLFIKLTQKVFLQQRSSFAPCIFTCTTMSVFIMVTMPCFC